MHHSSMIKKTAIIFVLVCFLLATAMTSILYLGGSAQNATGSVDAVPTNASDDTGNIDIAPGSILNAFATGN